MPDNARRHWRTTDRFLIAALILGFVTASAVVVAKLYKHIPF